MALDEPLEAMAGEYVLGTLSPAERLEAQTLLSQNSDFAAAVDLWTRRLAPLLLAARSIAPSAQLRERILASIGAASQSGNVVDLKVQNPDQFKVVKKGDQVEAVYTQALAVSVMPAKGADRK